MLPSPAMLCVYLYTSTVAAITVLVLPVRTEVTCFRQKLFSDAGVLFPFGAAARVPVCASPCDVPPCVSGIFSD